MPLAKTVTTTFVAVLTLSACTASRYQISDALGRYGMRPSTADCAANFLHGHLSGGQVNRLGRAARYYNPGRQMTFGDLISVAATLHDSQVALQVGAASLACGIVGNVPVPRF